jgi:hypothetical protein
VKTQVSDHLGRKSSETVLFERSIILKTMTPLMKLLLTECKGFIVTTQLFNVQCSVSCLLETLRGNWPLCLRDV